ncbi:MAG: chromosomal replication initiator protein DnaA [Bdellovibrionales bacterium]|nr:chromosomal replication initiator protein DnaA [Bdellovibrionales bacterium]
MNDCWQKTQAELKEQLSTHAFNTWIKPLDCKNSGKGWILEVPNVFYKIRVQKDYLSTIEKMLVHHSGRLGGEVRLSISAQVEKQMHTPDLEEKPSIVSLKEKKEFGPSLRLNQKYRFDEFVVGPNNQFAHAAAQAVASKLGKSYNPLLIYGGVGLGKTHLLHAIGHVWLDKNPRAKVLYRSSEEFVNELIQSIRNGQTERFRDQYRRQCDLLLLDDIQFFAKKERTQEEFFHTFNKLFQNNKQIVLTSDRMPHEIPDLDERLRSRFQSGLFCDIQAPDVETRVAIIRKKSLADHIDLPDEVSYYIASQVKTNVRVLEGCLIRLGAYTSLSGQPISLTVAKQILHSMTPKEKEITVEMILQTVAKFFHLKVSDLKSNKRHKVVAQPRQIAMYLCRQLTKQSFPELGQAFGGKDHSTILHGVSKISKTLSQDPQLHQTMQILQQALHEHV